MERSVAFEKIKIPLVSIGGIIGVAIAITLYVARVDYKVDTALSKNNEITEEFSRLNTYLSERRQQNLEYLRSLDQRLSRMEGKMDQILSRVR